MLYLFILLYLISLLCLQHRCRCPLTITFLSFGTVSSSIIKLLPFDNLYSFVIDMLVSLDSSILLFQTLTSEKFVAYLSILVYMFMTILSFEIPFYSVVYLSAISIPLVLVCSYLWSFAYSYILMYAYLDTPMSV
jgi:hypothetical protein